MNDTASEIIRRMRRMSAPSILAAKGLEQELVRIELERLVQRNAEIEAALLAQTRAPQGWNEAKWKLAALLKDRTRREIRERARLSGKAGHLAIAEDYGVPVEFVDGIASLQIFEDDAPHPLAAQEWQPIETAPKNRWIWFGRPAQKDPDRFTISPFRWDDSYVGWFSGTGWWPNVARIFTHWAEMDGQPPAPPGGATP